MVKSDHDYYVTQTNKPSKITMREVISSFIKLEIVSCHFILTSYLYICGFNLI